MLTGLFERIDEITGERRSGFLLIEGDRCGDIFMGQMTVNDRFHDCAVRSEIPARN